MRQGSTCRPGWFYIDYLAKACNISPDSTFPCQAHLSTYGLFWDRISCSLKQEWSRMIFLYSNPKYQVTSMNYYTEPDTIYFKNCMMLICLNVSKGLKFFSPNQRHSGNWDKRGAGRRGRENSRLSWTYSLAVLESLIQKPGTHEGKKSLQEKRCHCKHATSSFTSSLLHLLRWVFFFSLSQWCHYQVILKFFFLNEGVSFALCILNLATEFVLPTECHFEVQGPRTTSFILIWWLPIFSTSIGHGRVVKAGKLRLWGLL